MKAIDYREIWLQPWCDECAMQGDDRVWCEDNVWEEGCPECGAKPVKYTAVLPADDRRQDENRRSEHDKER